MSITTHERVDTPVRRNDAHSPSRPASQPDPELLVACPALPAAVQARLDEFARQHGRRLRFGLADPATVGEMLRLETPTGLALTDQRVRFYWHRRPYALSLRLMRYSPGSAEGALVDTAVIGTRGSRADFLDCVTRISERLIGDALCQASRGDPGQSFDPAAKPGTILPPRIDRALALWHTRLFAEWWSIGQTAASLREILCTGAVADVRWVAPARGAAYLADPFPWPGRSSVLCEEMPFAGGTGRIIALPVASEATTDGASVILEDADHHSYPCTFSEDGQVYFLPESTGRGATTLYRLSPEGNPTALCAIAPGRRLADSTLFRYGDRYWIACTDLDVGEHDNLCLLYADNLAGPWCFHDFQPVKIDICGARPAGTPFLLDNQLFRAGQNCASGYGAGITIHRVDALSPHSFHETVVARLRPDPSGPFPDGIHTLTADQTRVWIDGKRYVFDPTGFLRKLIRRTGLVRRGAGGTLP